MQSFGQYVGKGNWGFLYNVDLNLCTIWAVVVAQLVERSLPTPEIHGH